MTWSLQAVATLAPLPGAAAIALLAVAGCGPSLAALLIARRCGDGVYSLLGPRGLSARWAALALLGAPALTACAAALHLAVGGDAPSVLLTPMMLGVAVLAPLGEELGWRGFAHVQLAPRLGSLGAGLAIGAIWAVWHLPVSLALGGAAAGFLPYAARVIAASVLIAWLMQRTGCRTWVAIWAHAGLNLTVVRLPDTPAAQATLTAVMACAAFAAALALSRPRSKTEVEIAPSAGAGADTDAETGVQATARIRFALGSAPALHYTPRVGQLA